MPLASWIFEPGRWNFDVCFAQTTTLLLEFGIWLRKMNGIPLLCVNTTHLVAAYDVLLPEHLSRNDMVHAGVQLTLTRPFEKLFSNIYNQSDGLVVLSEGLRSYWRERGVTAPIHVIPRAVQPDIFDRALGEDPYTHLLDGESLPQRGPRLLCAGRHTREKSQDRVIRIFARHVLAQEPDATLTLVGDGPETDDYRRLARELGVEHRVFFTCEVPWTTMPDFYRYADVFVHASLSETYGNVMGEALWCGTPVVAFADGMGVTAQMQDGVNGVLFAPGTGDEDEVDRGRRIRARRRGARSRPASACPPRKGRGAEGARAVLAARRPAAHRGRVPARAGSRRGLRAAARGDPPEGHAVAHDAPARPAVDPVQRPHIPRRTPASRQEGQTGASPPRDRRVEGGRFSPIPSRCRCRGSSPYMSTAPRPVNGIARSRRKPPAFYSASV